MEPKAIDSITKSIHRKFPEVSGAKPTVRKQSQPSSNRNKENDPDKTQYLLTFKKNVKGPKGQSIPRWVRVVASNKGKIIKISTSK